MVKRKYVGNCMVVVLVLKLMSLEVMCLGCSWRRKKSEGQVPSDFILLQCGSESVLCVCRRTNRWSLGRRSGSELNAKRITPLLDSSHAYCPREEASYSNEVFVEYIKN
jgi:hypothetical protein